MNSIDTGRASFFPNSKTAQQEKTERVSAPPLLRNTDVRKKELDAMALTDAKVGISDAVKDFSRMKKVVDQSPTIDNSKKVASLKEQINGGTYKIDYDALADRMLEREF